MDYTESEKQLNQIRNQYGEMIFRMAISHLMDVGIRHLTDENVDATCEKIMEQDDSNSIIANRCQCNIVRVAAELAKIEHIYLLVYISRNVEYNVF